MALTSEIHLNDEKTFQFVGDILTLSGTTYVGNLSYLSNNSSQYNQRSIVDMSYVTGLTSTLLSRSTFNTYSGATNTTINNKLNITTFNAYTGTTTSPTVTGVNGNIVYINNNHAVDSGISYALILAGL